MARFHINPETGNPGTCRAKNACPFGDLEKDHYPTREAAQVAFEEQMLDEVTEAFSALSRSSARKISTLGGNVDPNTRLQPPDISDTLNRSLRESLRDIVEEGEPARLKDMVTKLREDVQAQGYPLPKDDPLMGEGVVLEGRDAQETADLKHVVYDLVHYEKSQGSKWHESEMYFDLLQENGDSLVYIRKERGQVNTNMLFKKYPHLSPTAKRVRREVQGIYFNGDLFDMTDDQKSTIARKAMEPRHYWTKSRYAYDLVSPGAHGEDGPIVATIWHSGDDAGLVTVEA